MAELAQIEAVVKSNLPALLGETLGAVYALGESAPDTAPSGTAIRYRFVGDYTGEWRFVFSAVDQPEVAALFRTRILGRTAGSRTPTLLETAQACQELANILVGRLLGALAEAGLSLELAGLGETLPAETAAAADFALGESVRLSAVPEGKSGPGTVRLQLLPAANTSPRASVLIVDDSPLMCAFLEKVLREAGYEVAGVAQDGAEAIELFERTHPDLMTLDIIMPKLKGTEVLERILAAHPEAKIIMASSVSDARTVMQCLKLGAKRYILKPYDQQAVLDAVRKVLGLDAGAAHAVR